MTTLYRSPNIIVDKHEWHVRVDMFNGRSARQYFFRPLSTVRYKWLPVTSWEGPKPRLWRIFQSHHRHIKIALESDLRRRTAAVRLAA